MTPVERLIPEALQLLAVVTGLVATALLLALLCARKGPAVRHGIWLFALLGALFSPLAIVAVNRTGFTLATIPAFWTARGSFPRGLAPPDLDSLSAPVLPGPGINSAEGSSGVSQQTGAGSPSSTAGELSKPLGDVERLSSRLPGVSAGDSFKACVRIGVITWALGFLILLARLLRGLFVLRMLRRSARPIDANEWPEALLQARAALGLDRLLPIAVSSRVTGPVALGVIQPLVIVPEGLLESLPPTALRDVIVHEMAHLVRRDPLVGLIQRLVELLYWPHPLIHLLNRRLSRAREEVCDNFVLTQGDACGYARTLLMLAERGNASGNPAGLLTLFDARWKLEDRVAGLVDPGRQTMTRVNRGSLAMTALLLLATGLTLAGVRLQEPVQATEPGPPAAISKESVTTSGPSCSEIADLIRAIGRDPVSNGLVDRIAAWYHPRLLRSGQFPRMKEVATDPQAVRHLDALANEVQGKPLDTVTLLRAAMSYGKGYDDAMMKQFLRDWIAEEKWMPLTIRGTVIDEKTRQPIPFPRVFADETIASSDKDGRFELTVKRKPGSKEALLWIEADGHASGEILVRNEDRPRVALRKDVPFFGKVVDQDGKPVAGAEVRFRVPRSLILLADTAPDPPHDNGHGVFQVQTDRDGRFSFQGMPDSGSPAALSGRMKAQILEAIARDREYNDPRWPYVIKARDVNGGALIDATFLKRAKGKGMANTFSARIHTSRAEIRFAASPKLMLFTFEDVEVQKFGDDEDDTHVSGRILAFALPADLDLKSAMQPIYVDVAHPGFQPSQIETTAPTRADTAPLIRLQPGLAVFGQVVDTQGKPIGEAWVQVRDPERGGYVATAFTDRTTGNFRTDATLKPGPYMVVAQSERFAASWRNVVVDKALPAQQFVLDPGGYISGKVVTASGIPIAGAAVGWAQPVSADRPPSRVLKLQTMTATDADGKFRLGPLPEGEFRIIVGAQSPRRQAEVTVKTGTAKIIKLPSE